MNTETATLPVSIREALAELDRSRARLLALVAVTTDAEAIANEFPDLNPSAMASAGNNAAWVTIWVRSLDEVADVRRALAARGYRMVDRSDYPEDNRFVIDHEREGAGRLYLGVHLSRSAAGAGKVCRYVQTGKKEVPVYELKCEETL